MADCHFPNGNDLSILQRSGIDHGCSAELVVTLVQRASKRTRLDFHHEVDEACCCPAGLKVEYQLMFADHRQRLHWTDLPCLDRGQSFCVDLLEKPFARLFARVLADK